MRATFANIYLDNLRHNILEIKKIIPKATKICIPVKADAYGHGAEAISKESLKCGVDYFAVAAVAEGVQLRQANISIPILVLSLPNPSEFDEIIDNNLTPVIFDSQLIEMFATTAQKHNKVVSVHLKVDTGMGRIGCKIEDALSLAKEISNNKWLSLAGIFTHFPVADSLDEKDKEYTLTQIKSFNNLIQQIKAEGINPGICHCSNSAGIFCYPEACFDMVRPGLITYGYYPGDITAEYLNSIGKKVELKPVMELRSRIVAINHMEKGKSVSYGREWIATEDSYIGVLPLGYADGLLRNYGKNLLVAIEGKGYPICGRICMDQCMVYLGNTCSIERWHEVIVFGPKEKGALQDASDIATRANTIPYEVTCGIDKRVPRIYIGG